VAASAKRFQVFDCLSITLGHTRKAAPDGSQENETACETSKQVGCDALLSEHSQGQEESRSRDNWHADRA
jgi:hypothetical protein